MGNYKFRFSDMMPNAWFYKLKDMGSRRRSRTQKTNTPSSLKKKQPTAATSQSQPPKSKQPHHLSHSRKSYYFTRDPISSPKFSNSPKYTHFPDDPPRKSSKQAAKKKISSKTPKSSPSSKLLTSSVSAATGCNCRVTFETVSDFSPEFTISPLDSSPDHHHQSESRSDDALVTESFDGMVALSSYSNSNDIVIDINKKSPAMKFETEDGFNSISELELPRIITKSVKSKHRKSSAKTESLSVSALKEEQRHTIPAIRRLSTHNSSPGMRLRVKSPRIANITTQIGGGGRRSISNNSSTSSSSRSRNGRSISDSFAVVKSSFNPQKDFKESMMEMIVENNIKASKDLEELLACYLSLNSDEYHDLIIKVFKQIWFDLTDSKWK